MKLMTRHDWASPLEFPPNQCLMCTMGCNIEFYSYKHVSLKMTPSTWPKMLHVK